MSDVWYPLWCNASASPRPLEACRRVGKAQMATVKTSRRACCHAACGVDARVSEVPRGRDRGAGGVGGIQLVAIGRYVYVYEL